MTNTHGEAGRNLESADNESGFGSVDSDACNGEILVEARLSWSLWRNQDSWHGLWLVLGQLLQKLLRLLLHLPLSKSLCPRLKQVPSTNRQMWSLIMYWIHYSSHTRCFFLLAQRPKSSNFDRIYGFVWVLFFYSETVKASTELSCPNYTRSSTCYYCITLESFFNVLIQTILGQKKKNHID